MEALFSVVFAETHLLACVIAHNVASRRTITVASLRRAAELVPPTDAPSVATARRVVLKACDGAGASHTRIECDTYIQVTLRVLFEACESYPLVSLVFACTVMPAIQAAAGSGAGPPPSPRRMPMRASSESSIFVPRTSAVADRHRARAAAASATAPAVDPDVCPNEAHRCRFGSSTSVACPDMDESTVTGYVARCLSNAPSVLVSDISDCKLTGEDLCAWCVRHVDGGQSEGESDDVLSRSVALATPHAWRPCDPRSCAPTSPITEIHERAFSVHDYEMWMGLLLVVLQRAPCRTPRFLLADLHRRGKFVLARHLDAQRG